MHEFPLIKKADGTEEAFDPEKLATSLRRTGAEEALIQEVVRKSVAKVHAHMTTSQIYRHAFSLLKRADKGPAARYAMRRAIFELGPTGFPFEHFVGEIFRKKGYEVLTGVTLPGGCVTHEVDVLLEKDGIKTACELKFHNELGYKTDIKTALYVKARIDDLTVTAQAKFGKGTVDKGMLVTNTKFTGMAIDYAMCAGLPLLGWEYPHQANLADLVTETRVYPVTVLTTLTPGEKNLAIRAGISLCHSLLDGEGTLKSLGFSPRRAKEIVDESQKVCSI